MVEAGTLPAGACEPVVEVDPVTGDAELTQPVTLGGEILGVGGAAGVADQGPGHDRSVTDSHPSLRIFPYHLCEMAQVLAVMGCFCIALTGPGFTRT